MDLVHGQILYISVLVCLFLILNIVVLMRNKIASFSMIIIHFSYFLYCFRNIINNRKKLIYLYNIMNLKHLIIFIVVLLIVLVSHLIINKRDQFYFQGQVECEKFKCVWMWITY